MKSEPTLAIVGATGLVGQTIVDILNERSHIAVGRLVPLATEGGDRTVTFRGETVSVAPLSDDALADVDLAFFAATNAVSEEWAPKVVERGGWVVDKSSRFRLDPDVPLVVPEVNGDAVGRTPSVVASPNCSTIQLVMALAALEQNRRVERVIVSTYQAVSGSGRAAVEQLEDEMAAEAAGEPVPPPAVYPAPIHLNVLPWCDAFGPLDFTGEEWKLTRETAKILGRPDLRLSATAVRVPVFVGHSESVYVELDQPATVDDVRGWLSAFPGVEVVDDPAGGAVPTPRAAAGSDLVYIGRLRQDPHEPRGLHLFVVSDNLRKGAAANAVDILEMLMARET